MGKDSVSPHRTFGLDNSTGGLPEGLAEELRENGPVAVPTDCRYAGKDDGAVLGFQTAKSQFLREN